MKIVYPYGTEDIAVAASDKVAVYSEGKIDLFEMVGYPNVPSTVDGIASVQSGFYTTSAFSAAATVRISAGAAPVIYDVGTAATVRAMTGGVYQGAPNALDATGTLTAAMVLGGIVTSTTAAAVTATLDTGAIMDPASDWAIGDAVDWSVINTGGANAITVTAAASGHTVVGAGAVAHSTSGFFRTRKTAADTFVTYRVG